MQIRLRVPMQLGDKAYFVKPSDKPGDISEIPYVELTDFKIEHGRAVWRMNSKAGHLIEGRIRDQQVIPYFRDSWIALAIPVKMDVKAKGLSADFIFCVPSSIAVERFPFQPRNGKRDNA